MIITDSPEFALEAAKGFISLGMPDDALSELETLPPSVKASLNAIFLRIEAYLSKEMLKEAHILLEGIKSRSFDNHTWHILRARCHVKQGNILAAGDHIFQAANINSACQNDLVECEDFRGLGLTIE